MTALFLLVNDSFLYLNNFRLFKIEMHKIFKIDLHILLDTISWMCEMKDIFNFTFSWVVGIENINDIANTKGIFDFIRTFGFIP